MITTITNGATATTSFGLLDKFLLFRVALFMAADFKFLSPGVLTSDPYSTHSSYDPPPPSHSSRIALNTSFAGQPSSALTTRPTYFNIFIIIIYRNARFEMSGCGLDDRAIEVQSPAEAKGFFLYLLCPEWLWGPPSLLYNGYQCSFPRGKVRSVCDANHPLPSRAGVMNEELYFFSHYAAMVCCGTALLLFISPLSIVHRS
jgi:hypothetical protein